MKPTPPKIAAVEVVAAQPTEADSAKIAHLSAATDRALPPVVYVVKVRLDHKPPPAAMAWALYVDEELIPKYWEYEHGIYFTVYDPQFFSEHRGEPLRFSLDGVDFFETGKKLTGFSEAIAAAADSTADAVASKSSSAKSPLRKSSKGKAKRRAASSAARLPLQADVLKE